jgi:hypothetical protein
MISLMRLEGAESPENSHGKVKDFFKNSGQVVCL